MAALDAGALEAAIRAHDIEDAAQKGEAPLPDLYGVLTQIDNLSAGLCRSPAPQGEDAEVGRVVRLLNALAVDHECNDEHDAKQTCDEAADRLAALSAERDAYRKGCEEWQRDAADAANAAHRAEAALAEKDRDLKEAIELLNEVVPIADPSIQLRKFLAARTARQAGGDHER